MNDLGGDENKTLRRTIKIMLALAFFGGLCFGVVAQHFLQIVK